jgi:tRNA-2-methylthio-N6-dimethylallyladenosine synthase
LIEEVLVEGPSRKHADVLTGRTRGNKLVHFRPDGPLRPGTFASVRVTGAAPHHLSGELVDVLAAPRHRTRIPVAAG